ncbi:spermatogenesis-associated protein 6-like isoform X1 [Hydractinia symbiolongicarpus]|uniref:spermatogenesis-associated protein 6-like isoform X1 n=1 Tax=Hydractinia symbiolongicarpus TaxID=13093 RepID=UPI002550D4F0|nr:spermatogenesis-associated protein 6-like isoform X1 [Hydractinia symbiolongicarpus]
MPRKAMKCIVEIDLHVITCPGTFLRDYEYVYLHMEMLGLEARTKSVPPTFPLFFHERLKFERTFYDCTDPALVAALLKGEDIIVELRQHTDYITDGKVISHCSSNTHDFLYPAIPPYYGSGREILLYKTAKFKPIRVTGEPVKLEFSTKTVIKEVPDYDTMENGDKGQRVLNAYTLRKSSSKESLKPKKSNLKNSKSTPDLSQKEQEEFVIRRKDDTVLSNRDFSTFVNPKPRRSPSPARKMLRQRSASPSRTKKALGNTTVESIPAWKYSSDYPHHYPSRHYRSVTDPFYYTSTPAKNLSYAFDDLNLSGRRSRSYISPSYYVSPNITSALNSSQRIQRRVDNILHKKHYSVDSDAESDYSLDLLRESLRDERNALNDAIKEADREAFYRSLNKTR